MNQHELTATSVPASAAANETSLQRVSDAIRAFDFSNYGMDEASYALEAYPDSQEWVTALAAAVLAVLPVPADRAAIYREVADRLAVDAEQGEQEGWTRIYKRAAAKKVRTWAADAEYTDDRTDGAQ